MSVQSYDQDVREYEFTPVADQGAETRADFILKTYVHLFAAIAAFALIEIALFKSGAAQQIAAVLLRGSWLLVLGGFMLVSWGASRVAHTAVSLPAQYAALAAMVVAQAIIFVPLLWIAGSQYQGVIESAAAATFAGFSGLTAIAFLTRKDFSFLRPLLYWIGLCAIMMVVMAVVFGFTLGPVFSVAMIAFAGAAILYDTSNVLHHFPKDRYVGASLELFASVALMFWYVLRIFMSRD